MPWLMREEEVLATLEVAESFKSRLKGLTSRDHFDGAFLIPRARSVHTFKMQFPIDVAFCDRDFRVIDIATLPPRRVGLPRKSSRYVIEAEAGSFDRWHLKEGDVLEIKR